MPRQQMQVLRLSLHFNTPSRHPSPLHLQLSDQFHHSKDYVTGGGGGYDERRKKKKEKKERNINFQVSNYTNPAGTVSWCFEPSH